MCRKYVDEYNNEQGMNNNPECYIISWDENDGKTMDISEAVQLINDPPLSMILISNDYAVIVAEPDCDRTVKYLLADTKSKVKQGKMESIYEKEKNIQDNSI